MPQNLFFRAVNFIRIILKQAWKGLFYLPQIRFRNLSKYLEAFQKKDFLAIAILSVIAIVSGSLLISGSLTNNGNVPDYGGEYIEGLVGQPRFINPVLAAASSVDSDLARIAYAQLLEFDKDLKLVPDLAEALPTVSADQKTYTIKLKPNLKWQDGKPLLADDVVFTIQTIQNSEYESPLRGNFNRVKAEKIDDLTISFTLREVSASFITNFTVGILPKHVWEGLPPTNFRLTDSNLRAVGSGPFAVREIKKTPDGTVKAITFRANDNYHAGRPWINRVTFKFYSDYDGLIHAYQSREIQGIGYLPFDKKLFLENSDKYNQYLLGLPQYQAVFFNLPKNSILADKAVRQGLWLATDRKTIIEQVYAGYAKQAYGPVLEGNLGYNPKVAEATHTSLEEAASILNKAGWLLDPATNTRVKKGRVLQFNLVTNDFVLNVKTAQILQSQWSALGASINVIIVSAMELEQDYIRTRNFDALLFAENTGPDPDPFSFWHSSQARDPGLNLSGFSHAEVDKLLTAARQTNDVNARSVSYQQFQMIILDALPAIFLDSSVFVYNLPKKIKGFDQTTIIHPSERFADINQWYIETR
ncbi:MAG: peptide ABC transporter substrate-binding protein [Candidatus Doudnabacteria bacterium]|nr:peptide ABC transporter substrate-binding protein [Candidatus Doudnabacteria bacterium]